MKDRRKKLIQALLIAAASTLLIGVLWLTGALDRWESTTWDWRMRALARHGATAQSKDESPVCLILLDQYSLDWGRETNGWSWPWPREVYTTIIDFCVKGEALSLSFDVLYTEASVYGVWDDQAFGEAIAASEFFVAAAFVHTTEKGAEKITLPISDVKDNCLALANVHDVPDADGVFRRSTLWMDGVDGEPMYSLGPAAALIGDKNGKVREVLAQKTSQQILRFHDPETFWPIYNAAEIVQSDLRLQEGGTPTVDPSVVKGKHVFFGMSAPGLMDLRSTPLNRVSPGVTIHATTLENLLNDDFISESSTVVVLLVSFILSFLAAGLLLVGGKLWRTIAVILGFLLLPSAVGYLLARGGLWWPVVPETLAHGSALGGALILAWATEGRQKKFIRQAFRHYLSPDVIQRIMDNPDSLKLGGERREMTIFFSDLEGFTTMSEGLEPQELTQLLNEYLTDMTDIILESGGTLDKYEGDAIIAFWNAPVDQPDHALRACRASVLCQRKLTERRAEFEERFGATMLMRIGLNTGPVIVGNMGSTQRFDYTVLGDAANLAARLEGANKVFGTYLMISDATRKVVDSEMMFRELGDLRVVGRKQPVRVYELEGFAGEAEPDHWSDYSHALDLCKNGKQDEAKLAMSLLAKNNSGDPAAQKWLDRLENENEGFDAVWNLTRK